MPGATFCFSACPQRGGRCGYNAAVTSIPAPVLPDVAHQTAALARPLDWVGMDNIALPIRITDGQGGFLQVPASIDLAVDLARADARGIHMSRLYLQLQDGLAREAITPAGLRHLLQDGIAAQAGLSTRARLRIRYDALLQRRALASGYSGWKRYPVQVEALLIDRFAADFAAAPPPSAGAVSDWLASERGMAATPHAQRSRADVRVQLRPQFDELPLVALVDALEAALGTPVQTAVKREDEQAFARLNAANLMFCEDAARRVASVLASDPRVEHYEATVSHFESLHPHDAVARVSGRGI